MAEDEGGERTEDATTQRREDFRRQGQVVQSKELASVLFLMVSAGCIWALGRFFLEQIVEVYQAVIGNYTVTVARSGDLMPAVQFAGIKAMFIIGPVFLIAMIIAFMSSVIQIGFIYNEDSLQFDFEKLNPISGFQRIFSMRSLVEGLKALLKLILVGSVAYVLIKREIIFSPSVLNFEIEQLVGYLGSSIVKLVFGIAMMMLVLAIADYGFLYWEMEKKMRMTKQEVKEEHKAREGDPIIKARIRKIQRELANKRMMEDVPKAAVIITNPTHIAIALKYDESLPAPQVVAKGAGIIAEKIKELAKLHKIPVVENKPLARTIYKTLKIGALIPRELYNVVAEVLAYVFRLKKKRAVN